MWIFFQWVGTAVLHDLLLVESANMEPWKSRVHCKVTLTFSTAQRVCAPNPCIVQGSTVLGPVNILHVLAHWILTIPLFCEVGIVIPIYILPIVTRLLSGEPGPVLGRLSVCKPLPCLPLYWLTDVLSPAWTFFVTSRRWHNSSLACRELTGISCLNYLSQNS